MEKEKKVMTLDEKIKHLETEIIKTLAVLNQLKGALTALTEIQNEGEKSG